MARSTRDLERRAAHTLSRSGISHSDLARELEALGPRWSVQQGVLRLQIDGPMSQTATLAAFAGVLAEELDHHPTIVIEKRGLLLAIRTPDAKAISVLDLVFAARIEQWLRDNDWPI